jgi:DNA-directed RNA polymerase specialized sigma24 family protein
MEKSKDLSSDVKTIIIRNYEAGKSYSEIGRNLQLNRATVYAVIKRYRERVDIYIFQIFIKVSGNVLQRQRSIVLH